MERLQPRILIADDDAYARHLIEIALSGSDYQLISLADGAEARREIDAQLPSLAILDIQMPGQSGIDLCRLLKEQSGRFVPVILLTAANEIGDKIHGLNCGADDYVTKPFQPAELEARVRSLLRIKQLTEELSATKNVLAERERELVALQVAGGAAHELGQPLTTVLLQCQLMKSQAKESEALMNALSGIVAECHYMRDVLERMRTLPSVQLQQYAGGVQIASMTLDTQSSPLEPAPEKR